MNFREHVMLAPYTTFQIGGPARWYAEAGTEAEAAEGVRFARAKNIPLLVLGGGSNLLVADRGYPGLALHIVSSGIDEREGGPSTREFTVAAGEDWDAFVSRAVEQGCGGIECLAGIPGTVGGTPVQNVGAYGQEVASTIVRVRVLDRTCLVVSDLPASACGFGYRRSIFNTVNRDRYIILSVMFRLQVAAEALISYKDLKLYFKNRPAPSLQETATVVRHIRQHKGMLIVPGDPDCRSAGSFFKNPMVPVGRIEAIAAAAGIEGAAVPAFPAGAGAVKVPAAWLLEQAGFHRGFARGRAAISSRHTLALTNLGGATAGEILELRDGIMEGVQNKFGIRLETEPVLVGM